MRTRADAIRRSMTGPWAQESVVKVQRAALRAPRGQMPTACPREPLVTKGRCASLGGGPQAMSVCIVEGRQQRPGPPTAACGGNGGRARWARGLATAAPEAPYRGPGSAATRRELSRATFAEPTYPRDTVLTIEYAQPHGSCWPLPSSVCRRLHGPECGLRFRCSSSTIHTGIVFVVAPCARLTSTAR